MVLLSPKPHQEEYPLTGVIILSALDPRLNLCVTGLDTSAPLTIVNLPLSDTSLPRKGGRITPDALDLFWNYMSTLVATQHTSKSHILLIGLCNAGRNRSRFYSLLAARYIELHSGSMVERLSVDHPDTNIDFIEMIRLAMIAKTKDALVTSITSFLNTRGDQ